MQGRNKACLATAIVFHRGLWWHLIQLHSNSTTDYLSPHCKTTGEMVVVIWVCPLQVPILFFCTFEEVWSVSTQQRFLQYSEATKVSKKNPHNHPTNQNYNRTPCSFRLSRLVIQPSPSVSSFHKSKVLDSVNQTNRIFDAGGLTDLFTLVDREWMKIKGFNSPSACTVQQLFQHRTLYSQSCISLYRWLSVRLPHVTNPKLIRSVSQKGYCWLLEQEEHGNRR